MLVEDSLAPSSCVPLYTPRRHPERTCPCSHPLAPTALHEAQRLHPQREWHKGRGPSQVACTWPSKPQSHLWPLSEQVVPRHMLGSGRADKKSGYGPGAATQPLSTLPVPRALHACMLILHGISSLHHQQPLGRGLTLTPRHRPLVQLILCFALDSIDAACDTLLPRRPLRTSGCSTLRWTTAPTPRCVRRRTSWRRCGGGSCTRTPTSSRCRQSTSWTADGT